MFAVLLAAKVWHFWIGVALFLGCVATVVALVAGYLATVTRPQYPRRGQRTE
jgi:hypothetical protein